MSSLKTQELLVEKEKLDSLVKNYEKKYLAAKQAFLKQVKYFKPNMKPES